MADHLPFAFTVVCEGDTRLPSPSPAFPYTELSGEMIGRMLLGDGGVVEVE